MKTYTVWCPEDGEESPHDGREFQASCPEYAAQEWAERRDSEGDYGIVRNEASMEVMVFDGEVSTKYQVRGAISYDYYAEPSP
jgi:hypothetical protein